MARGTIREERPDLLKYLVNEEDGDLSCGSNKIIQTKCPICNTNKNMILQNLTKVIKYNCNNCNSIKIKRPDLLKYLVNKKDGDLSYGSNEKIKIKCLKCNAEKYVSICDFTREDYGFRCSICSSVKNKNPEVLKYLVNKDDEFLSSQSSKSIEVKCPICNQIKYTVLSRLVNQGFHCDNCNSLKYKRPDLIKYIINESDKNLSYGSNKKIKLKCPICGYKKYMSLSKLNTYGFSCPKCSDGVSYPNKFMFNFLEQLKIEFVTEKSFTWSDNKIYDFYIPKLKCIIEVHGLQHYEKGFDTCGGRTVNDEKINDKLKKQLALNNNIKHYIELDCRQSELEWIKKSIMSSDLIDLLNLKNQNINWIDCEKNSLNSLVRVVCDLWNEGYKHSEIRKKTKLSNSTILKYLKKGNDLNLCDYATDNFKSRNRIGINEKRVFCENKIFESIKKCADYYNINRATMNGWLIGRTPMPQRFINLNLRYLNDDETIYKTQVKFYKRLVMCNNILFDSITKCAEYYKAPYSNMTQWLNGKKPIPQKYIDLGLRYATEEDLNTYELYKELN